MAPDPIDLVFEGGGVKGVGLAGAAGRLTTRGFRPRYVGGSSAGAIVAALYSAGYTDEGELRDLLTTVPFSRFQDRSLLDHIPLAGPLISVIGDLGIYEGNALEQWMDEVLAAKGVATFGDLRADGDVGDGDIVDHRCQIVIADLTDRSVLVLPRDADRLGLDPDSLSVARVVRASSAIPFFFEPVTLRNRLTGVDHVLVDGGLLSNFPVWLFDVLGEPQLPTFGINLVSENPRSSPIEEAPGVGRGRHGIIDHIRSVVGTMIEARDKLALAGADRVRTIDVPNLGIATTDFGISLERAMELFDHGAAAVDRFLGTWDFDSYKAEHRIC